MLKLVLKVLLRFGLFAKGAIYVTIGAIALRVALGGGGKAADTQGALNEIGSLPFGGVALVILAIGLLHFAGWKLAQAYFDPDDVASKEYGNWLRAWFVVIGLLNLYLAYKTADHLLSGWGVFEESSSDDKVQSWTSVVLQWPGGPWIVGLGGLVAFGVCIGQLVFAYRAKFEDAFHAERTSPRARLIMIWLGRVGIGSRAMVAAIIGIFFVQAMLTENPKQAGGISDALQSLLTQPFGPWLLGANALGLLGYGFFIWGLARYQAVTKEAKS